MNSVRWAMLLDACLLGLGPVTTWAGDPPPNGSERIDRYVVPQDDVANLVKFVGDLAVVRPTTPEEDAEHRAQFRPVLQQVAEKIPGLGKHPAAEAYQLARFILLANRVRWLAQTLPNERRKSLADVRAYLPEKRKEEMAAEAADLANVTVQTLQHVGRWELEYGDPSRVPDRVRIGAARVPRSAAYTAEAPVR